MNKVIIIGNMGNDPEHAVTPNGYDVYHFRVASHRSYTKPDGTRTDDTEWFSCSAFGTLGERCRQLLRKGRQVYVEGRIGGSSYIDRNGQSRHSLNVTVKDFVALGPRDFEPNGTTHQYTTAATSATPRSNLITPEISGRC